jgi:hypothetical protein
VLKLKYYITLFIIITQLFANSTLSFDLTQACVSNLSYGKTLICHMSKLVRTELREGGDYDAYIEAINITKLTRAIERARRTNN